VIQRADELSEFLAIYWAEGRQLLSGQVKKGLAAAFAKFDEYALAKYDRATAVRLRDVLFLSHAKPVNAEQAAVWKRLAQNEQVTPDTWEVALSSIGRTEGVTSQGIWERLLSERRLGTLALLRNLRNMQQAGVREEPVKAELASMNTDRVLPFRFLAAARHAPQWEKSLEAAMSRSDAAYGLAILLQEVAEKITIYSFSSDVKRIPARRGTALRDALDQSQLRAATFLGSAVAKVEAEYGGYKRLIVITDEQAHDSVTQPAGVGYMINVASNRNGVGYGCWVHIDGFSEAVIEYIVELEQFGAARV